MLRARRTAPNEAIMNIISTPNAPQPSGHYAQAIVHGDLVYVAGQIPKDPRNGELKTASVEEQIEQVLQNLAAVLEAAGSGMGQILKLSVYISSSEYWPVVNDACIRHFGEHRPARVIVPVGQFSGFDVEADAIAVVG